MSTQSNMQRVFDMTVASVYKLYVAKVERKGRTVDELDQVICWLTGFDATQLQALLETDITFRDFFAQATLPADASKITGVICGVRVEEITDPLAQQIRYLDKLVDELAKGRALERVLRGRERDRVTALGACWLARFTEHNSQRRARRGRPQVFPALLYSSAGRVTNSTMRCGSVLRHLDDLELCVLHGVDLVG
ncbi:DUF2200 domain-containing protein [Pseudoclavibacter sp. 13-3]|uniref:DUF2200 domain-containing protein n=1 Tax=Pseudoclavibacter sp. 13-3 TaxID=2901228 RepID=UPI002F90E670